jgi:hypothetical protein
MQRFAPASPDVSCWWLEEKPDMVDTPSVRSTFATFFPRQSDDGLKLRKARMKDDLPLAPSTEHLVHFNNFSAY